MRRMETGTIGVVKYSHFQLTHKGKVYDLPAFLEYMLTQGFKFDKPLSHSLLKRR